MGFGRITKIYQGNDQGAKGKGQREPEEWVEQQLQKVGHNDASGWHGKEKHVSRIRNSSLSTMVVTDVDKKVGRKTQKRAGLAWSLVSQR